MDNVLYMPFPSITKTVILASSLSSLPCGMCFVFIIDLVPRPIYKAQTDILCFTDGTLWQTVLLICSYLEILELKF